jgi:hypothetical protein
LQIKLIDFIFFGRFEDAVNGGSRRWTTLYRERWGQPGAITTEASKLAGGWKKLYKAKHLAEKESNPWIQPCEHEVQAMLNHLAAFTTNTTTSNTNNSNGTSKSGDKVGTAGGVGSAAAAAAPPSDAKMTVTFLVDGSGSVTEEDFSTMTTFMTKAVQTVNAHTCEKSMFGVLQFSNEVREELTLSHITTREFDKFAKQLSRMNGGTNIALALSRACRMVKSAATAVSNPSSVEEIDLSEESNANATTNAAASITAESDAVVVGAQEVQYSVCFPFSPPLLLLLAFKGLIHFVQSVCFNTTVFCVCLCVVCFLHFCLFVSKGSPFGDFAHRRKG